MSANKPAATAVAVANLLPQLVGPLARRTVQLAFDELPHGRLQFSDVASGTFGATSLASLTGSLKRRGAELVIVLRPVAGRGEGLLTLRALSQRMNEPVRLQLQDGSEVVGRLGHCSGQSTRVNLEIGQVEATGTIVLDDWSFTSAAAPCVWFGHLRGATYRRGNVFVQDGERSVDGQVLRLVGHFTWHLVKRANGCDVLIEAASGQPRSAELAADFEAMQFVFGRPLKLSTLAGIDDLGAVVAFLGLGFGYRPTRGGAPPFTPAPGIDEPGDSWVSVLFPLAAKAIAQDWGSGYLHVVVAALLDSVTDNLDGAYLKLQVAIEAYCSSLAARANRPLLVKNVPNWEKWIQAHEGELREHATDEGAAKVFINRLRSNAPQRPSSDAVATGLSTIGLHIPDELLAETKRRNVPAHRFLMNTPGPRNFDEDGTRVRRLQALAIALVAQAAGYGGPILDPSVETPLPVSVATWWRVSGDPFAGKRMFRCSTDAEQAPEAVASSSDGPS